MKVKELMLTCMNQWGNGLKINKKFKIHVIDEKRNQTFEFTYNYINERNWNEIENDTVNAWELYNNKLKIQTNIGE